MVASSYGGHEPSKKPDLDPTDVKSFRPISNLTVLSKLLERLVARQLLDHVSVHKLLPDFQSTYRAQHSTETAVLKVLTDILTAADCGDLSMLTLLDQSYFSSGINFSFSFYIILS